MKKILNLTVLFSLSVVLFLGSASAQTWEPTSGPYGGSVQCFAENSSYLFAGVGQGVFAKGVFRSSDHGANWTSVSNGISTSGQGLDVVAFGQIGNYLVESSGGNIYRSDNNGDSWTVTNYSAQYNPLCFISDGTNLFCGGSSGLYVSTDNGLNWTAQNDSFPGLSSFNPPAIRALTYCGTYLYAACANGQKVYRSANNGVNWEKVWGGLTSPNITASFTKLAVVGTDIYAGTIGKGVFHLVNNGTTWTREVTNLTSGGNLVMELLAKDNTLYCSTNDGFWSSSTSGTLNWTRVSNMRFMCFFKSGTDIFGGYNNLGIYVSNGDLSAWYASNDGLTGYSAACISKIGTDLYATTAYSNLLFKSTNLGKNWTYENANVDNGPFLHGTSLFCGYQGSYILRSTDNGASWQQINSFWDLAWSEPTAFCSKGDTLFAGGGQSGGVIGIFYSLDNGDTWTQSVGCDFAPSSITSIGNRMYAGTPSGSFFSEDNGLNWTPCFPTLAGGSLYFNSSNIYALNSNGLSISTDNGAVWTNINDKYPQSLAFNGADLYISTLKLASDGVTFVPAGIFKSTDNGANWTEFDEGFTKLPWASSLAIADNYIFLNNSTGLPVYRRALSGSVPAQTSPIVGAVSPCANSTQIYSVDHVADVTYTWEVPQDWTIIVGQNTDSVTVTVGSFNGMVKVTPSNGWGSGLSQTISVTPSGSAPAQPSAITGAASPCFNTTLDYSVTNVAGVNYDWTIPSDWTLNSGAGTNSINVTVGNSTGNIQVIPSNSCDAGVPQTLAVTTTQIPAQPSTITGSTAPCAGVIKFYSVTNTNGVTYDWTLPSDWNLESGAGSHTIAVTVGNTSGDITVIPSNTCGAGTSQVLSVTASEIPTQPVQINGNPNPVINSSETYSVDAVSGETYAWIFPTGWVKTAGGNTNSVTVTVGSNPGDITCTPSNSCGTGTLQTLAVTSTVGVAVINNNAEINIYPNPTDGKITVSLNGLSGKTMFSVQNIFGCVILNSDFDIQTSDFVRNFDFSNYSKGIYYIKIINGGKSFVHKFVVK